MLNSLLLFLAVLVCIPLNQWLTKKGMPDSAVNILLGALVGPLLLNWVTYDEVVAFSSEVSVVALLFVSGLSIHWAAFRQNLFLGSLLGGIGIVFSLLLGFIAAYAIDNRLDEALYVAVALSATSIGISIESFRQYKLQNTPMGNVLLAAAVLDDIIALYLMSSLHSLSANQLDGVSIFYSMLSALATLLALILLLFYIARWINKSQIFESILQRVLIYVILGGSSAIVTHMADLSSALGAFIAGMMITIAGHEQKTHIYTRCRFEKLFRWMVPVFFLSIGVQVTQLPVSGGHLMLLTSVLLAAAIIGKLFSPWCVKNHFSQRERWTLGFALLPRGEVGLIVASMGLQLGHVSEHMMIALVTMTLATALIAPIGIAIASRPLQSK